MHYQQIVNRTIRDSKYVPIVTVHLYRVWYCKKKKNRCYFFLIPLATQTLSTTTNIYLIWISWKNLEYDDTILFCLNFTEYLVEGMLMDQIWNILNNSSCINKRDSWYLMSLAVSPIKIQNSTYSFNKYDCAPTIC